jgi:signal transduction histidine kinase
MNAPGVDMAKRAEFIGLHTQMREALSSLNTRLAASHVSLSEIEALRLDRLSETAEQRYRLFVDQITFLDDIIRITPDLTPVLLEQFQEMNRELLNELTKLSERLAEMFEERARQAVDQAQLAWDVSIDVSRIILPVAILLSLLIVELTHRAILRPVERLVKGTSALAEGDLSQRIPVTGPSEFRRLANAFNRMAAALDVRQKQLVEAEKMAGVGRLAAGVAHEINNPLSVILGYCRMLLGVMDDEADEREQIQTIEAEARICKQIVDGLLDMSRPSDAPFGEIVNPAAAIGDVLTLVKNLKLTQNVALEVDVPDDPLGLTISRSRFRQLTLNIVRNALEVLQDLPDAQLRVSGRVVPRGEMRAESIAHVEEPYKAFLVITFEDNGPGIPPDHVKSLFEPFFTTKATGTGLGLAITYNIARAHGGFIDVESTPFEGTTFRVGLPVIEGTT